MAKKFSADHNNFLAWLKSFFVTIKITAIDLSCWRGVLVAKNRSNRALLVVNVRQSHQFIAGEIEYFRSRDRKVIFFHTEDTYDEMAGDALRLTSEMLVTCRFTNIFLGTDLLSFLRDWQISTVTIVGGFLETHILRTASYAIDNGIFVAAPEPCVIAKDEKLIKPSLAILNSWQEKFSK